MGKFKDEHGKSRVGVFLQKTAPKILETVGDLTGREAFNKVADLIKGDSEISAEDKFTALELIEYDIKELEEITKRWQADSASDNSLSKNIRPMTLLILLSAIIVFTMLDLTPNITVGIHWVNVYKELLFVVIVAYFGSRGYEKIKKRN